MDNEDVIAAAKLAKAPDWFAGLNQQDCVRMDVRPILRAGIDPLEQILAKVEQISPDAVLLIEAPFDPLPLRRLMAGRGYASHPVQLSDRHWQTFFKKQQERKLPQLPSLPDFPMRWQDAVLEMDLRKLVPPNPMIAVLKVIESGVGSDAFTVLLNRDPIYLYPELVERSWRAEVMTENSDGLRVRIEKINSVEVNGDE